MFPFDDVIMTFFIHINALENVVCQMAAILLVGGGGGGGGGG